MAYVFVRNVTIINVKDFGFYVELDDVFIEGLVAVQTLIDDYYRFDEGIHALVGRAGKRFHLGDRVRVRVDRVNVDRHLVDFALIGHHGKTRTMQRPATHTNSGKHKPRFGKRKR